jgi:hypothetical protein
MGLHHTGIEIDGKEWSYGSGGGIFDGPTRVAPGAKYRTTIEMGVFEGGSSDLNRSIDELRHDEGFSPNGYSLVKRNCNHFCNALVWKLLQRTIPPYINRIANIGDCCSCLLPKQLLEDSPVGGSGGGGSSSSNSNNGYSLTAVPTRASATMNRGSATDAFSGKGYSLSGNTTPSTESVGLLSRWSSTTKSTSASTTSSSSYCTDDVLTDRRERARMAALARFERNQQEQEQSSTKQS